MSRSFKDNLGRAEAPQKKVQAGRSENKTQIEKHSGDKSPHSKTSLRTKAVTGLRSPKLGRQSSFHLYSYSVLTPGSGMGYLPSLSGITGASPSGVMMSTLGAKAWSQLNICS